MLQTGSLLNHYRIVRLLATGGMGEVYVAEDTKLRRSVALKTLPAAMLTDAGRRERFEREATAVAALNHPGIVTIHSVENAGDIPFLTMELVEGKPLSDVIPRGGLALKPLLKLAVPLLDAVSAAHQRGITHRDLKPANVMVTSSGHVKVLDFGLAKLRDPDPPSESSTMAAETATAEKMLVGTAAYMSPEQAEGKTLDQRSDIFSLGIVLFEMATGQRPFKGDSAVSTISSIIKDPPPLATDINASLPAEFARIVRRALAKDPERRYQSAKDFRNELEELGESLVSGERVGPIRPAGRERRSRRGIAVTAAAVAGLAAVLAAAWRLQRSGGERDRPAPAPSTFSVAQITSQAATEFFPSLSPDGKWLIYTGDATGNFDIYLQSVGAQTAINLTRDSAKDDWQGSFSPDGDRIAFRSGRDGGGIFLMGRTGESVTRLTDAGFNPAWSPDGLEIAYADEPTYDPTQRGGTSHIWNVDLTSRRRTRVTEGDGMQPSWSPHRHRIAYWAIGGQNRVRDIWTVPAGGGEPRRVTDDPSVDWNPLWSPDGKYLYFISNRSGSMNLWRVAIDEKSGRTLAAPEPLTTPAPSIANLSFSADGKRLAFSSIVERSNIQSVEFDPDAGVVRGAPAAVTSGTRVWRYVDPSPDGEWVAFASGPPQEDIYVSRMDGIGLRQLSDDSAFDRAPRWSPDGSRIAFFSNRAGMQQIWSIRPDGSDLEQMTDLPGMGLLQEAWSPDGTRIAGFSQSAMRILIVNTQKPWPRKTAEELPRLDGDRLCGTPAWSPDGGRIACQADREPRTIAIYRFDTQSYTELPGGGPAVWLNDGQRLLLMAEDGRLMLTDLRTKQARPLLSLLPDAIVMPRVTRDNRRVVFARAGREGDVYMLTFK